MFDDNFFEQWLDTQAQKVMEQVASGNGVSPEQMMILLLKAQTNHFVHLDIDLRNEMKALREDMDKRFEQVERRIEQIDKQIEHMDKRLEQIDKRFEQVDKRFEQVDKRFEQVDKRFEQVDKRFEQIDKRFEQLTSRIDHFMVWSFATTLTVGGIVVAMIKFM